MFITCSNFQNSKNPFINVKNSKYIKYLVGPCETHSTIIIYLIYELIQEFQHWD